MTRLIWISFCFFLLTGCSILKEIDKTKDWSQKKLFTEATYELKGGDYEKAIDYYEKLESRYPFGKYVHQAQLNTAYAYYRSGLPKEALAAADRFIKFHPDHPAIAYVYYLRGLINQNSAQGLFNRFIPTDNSQRDIGATKDSYKDFAMVVNKFPDTEYAEDARKRMLYLRNNLARHEIHVARFYIKRGAYIAAANRASYVVTNYQRTPAIRDALNIMIESYSKLGMKDLEKDARRVLALNQKNRSLIDDPLKVGNDSLSENIWKFFGLDEN
tara:strand:+ start:1875 stop:2690 length:816 start_codon:yes stop_codon:yes gene_type:complete